MPASLPDKLKADVVLVTGRTTLLLLQITGVPTPVAQVIPPGGDVPAVTARVTGAMPWFAAKVKVGEVAAGAP